MLNNISRKIIVDFDNAQLINRIYAKSNFY